MATDDRRCGVRQRLQNRRLAEHYSFQCNGIAYTASTGRFPDGRLAEIFIAANGKAGSHADSAARDSAVVCSIALQFGVPVDVIRHALLKDESGAPAGPLGIALNLIGGDE
jgi:ribonucleoside-diphosphate reductase alpha chain